MKRVIKIFPLIALFIMLAGFNLDNALVPREEILSGGPPKDGIPALLKPKFITAQEADFLEPGDKVIGVHIGGEARAYPIKILNWHEVVNDTIAGIPIVVTF